MNERDDVASGERPLWSPGAARVAATAPPQENPISLAVALKLAIWRQMRGLVVD